MCAPSQAVFPKGCYFPVMCLPRPRSFYTLTEEHAAMVGLASGFPKTQEKRPDGIFDPCYEFKVGDERCDVVFRLLSIDNQNVACLELWLRFFWSLYISRKPSKHQERNLRATRFFVSFLSFTGSTRRKLMVKIRMLRCAALPCKNVQRNMMMSRPWLGDVAIYLSVSWRLLRHLPLT